MELPTSPKRRARADYVPGRSASVASSLGTFPHTSTNKRFGSRVVSWDLIWARGYGLWTLPRLWKTREARAARVAFGLGEGCELVTNAGAAFSTIAWKTLRVSHERPQAPPDIYKKESFIWNKEVHRFIGGYGKRPFQASKRAQSLCART